MNKILSLIMNKCHKEIDIGIFVFLSLLTHSRLFLFLKFFLEFSFKWGLLTATIKWALTSSQFILGLCTVQLLCTPKFIRFCVCDYLLFPFFSLFLKGKFLPTHPATHSPSPSPKALQVYGHGLMPSCFCGREVPHQLSD
eukprot:TRINITY_DN455_c0_g1_i12.p1 TRINITY_DN455_c0_g1~~TRINITY_DN455_c0_g1_i12.p1  ORF type:complete len:140 (-),score=3.42 TRINITY_DN455_c0_g1_i12:1508-1927(-)